MYGGLWVTLFCCHVTYLSVFKFDYGYNIAACVSAGTASLIFTVCAMTGQSNLFYYRCSLWCCMGDMVYKGQSLYYSGTSE